MLCRKRNLQTPKTRAAKASAAGGAVMIACPWGHPIRTQARTSAVTDPPSTSAGLTALRPCNFRRRIKVVGAREASLVPMSRPQTLPHRRPPTVVVTSHTISASLTTVSWSSGEWDITAASLHQVPECSTRHASPRSGNPIDVRCSLSCNPFANSLVRLNRNSGLPSFQATSITVSYSH